MADHPINEKIDLLDGVFYADDPHPHFAWMRAHAPVYYDEKRSVWGISLHEDVMRVSKDSETFCNGQGMRPDSPPIPSMINMDAPQHMRRRSLVNRGFTPKRIHDQADKVRAICVDLIEKARARGEFDFVADVAAPLPMIMIGDMLGVDPEDRDMLLRWSDALILGTSATAKPEAIAGAAQAFGEYAAY
ncbi:MAG: cytochrome P450, partial [Proteobacteria bacterium]|nr:cytochrome P450 [Pseudomonadota bacterium]